MDPLSAGIQVLGILKGGSGAQSPTVSSSSAGSFAGQTLIFGGPTLPDWSIATGGNGPSQAYAFGQPRADSFVMGLTGLNTSTGFSAGSGTAVTNQPTQPQGALGPSWSVIGLVAAASVALVLILK